MERTSCRVARTLTRQGFFPTYVLHTCAGSALLLVLLVLFLLSDAPSMGGVLGIILLYVGGQLLEGMYLSPRIMGRETGLHPVVVLVAILIGGTLFGLLGIIVALPVTAVLQVVLHRWHRA